MFGSNLLLRKGMIICVPGTCSGTFVFKIKSTTNILKQWFNCTHPLLHKRIYVLCSSLVRPSSRSSYQHTVAIDELDVRLWTILDVLFSGIWPEDEPDSLLGLLNDVFLEACSLFLTLLQLRLHHLNHLLVLFLECQVLERVLMQCRSFELFTQCFDCA